MKDLIWRFRKELPLKMFSALKLFIFIVFLVFLFTQAATQLSAAEIDYISGYFCYLSEERRDFPYEPCADGQKSYFRSYKFGVTIKNNTDKKRGIGLHMKSTRLNSNMFGYFGPYYHFDLDPQGTQSKTYFLYNIYSCPSKLSVEVFDEALPWAYGQNVIADIPLLGLCPGIPTPTPAPSCALALQQVGYSGSGTPLVNNYNATYGNSPQYTLFTTNKTGYIDKVEVYGNLDRDVAKGNKALQCKITNSTGTTTLGESNINNGPFSKGSSWIRVQFSRPVNVTNGITYRLYCKVENIAGGGYIYWLDFWNNRTDKTRKIYLCN